MSDVHEWERDAVAWLAGRRAEVTQSSARVSDARLARAMSAFRAWQAAAGREDDAARFAAQVRERVAALGCGVRRVDRAPEPARPTLAGPLAPMIVAAREVHAAPLVELGVAAGTGRELLDEPCDAWIALPAGLPRSRYVALRVVGDSMTPLLHSEDVVLVDLDLPVRQGAVTVARHPEHGYVVKRVGWDGTGRPGYQLQSLNPVYPAMELDPGTGTLFGPVVLRWCAHRVAKPRLAPGS